jgi:hypothetical protein
MVTPCVVQTFCLLYILLLLLFFVCSHMWTIESNDIGLITFYIFSYFIFIFLFFYFIYLFIFFFLVFKWCHHGMSILMTCVYLVLIIFIYFTFFYFFIFCFISVLTHVNMYNRYWWYVFIYFISLLFYYFIVFCLKF